LDADEKPLRFTTFPGSLRKPLPGRDFGIPETLGHVLERRRSIREYGAHPLSLETLGRFLYASFGLSRGPHKHGDALYRRPSASAGGLYPLELYLATREVSDLDDGVYHYDARAHELELLRSGAVHHTLVDLTLGQAVVEKSNVVVVVAGVRHRSMYKYGQRGYRFVLLDAGHLGQNMYLVATALGLGPTGIGGFLDAELNALMAMPGGHEAVYVVCIGQPAGATQAGETPSCPHSV
jgi:SagB-type dehydrogenase family enzyme